MFGLRIISKALMWPEVENYCLTLVVGHRWHEFNAT